jgi:hypothetical protein
VHHLFYLDQACTNMLTILVSSTTCFLQRKYNNGLTRGLLELAAEEGYVFEDFTFAMVRDRIRCYYKSHSQSAKKKRKR